MKTIRTKIFLKKLTSAVGLLLAISITVNAQTNVSGGIYANTAWTLAGSPYIVVDTVVVFPGVTLTIDPGVEVRFANNKRLEIRQATLIAVGTSADSITFTSNSLTPTPGIWSNIYLNQVNNTQFNYCNILYADDGIRSAAASDSLIIKNSLFKNNINGIGYISSYRVIIDSCEFRNNTYGLQGATGRVIMSNSKVVGNQYGIYHIERSTYRHCIIDSNNVIGINTAQHDTIIDCVIRYNGIGLENGTSGGQLPSFISRNIIENNVTGFKLIHITDEIFCNKICNNTSYDLEHSNSGNTNCMIDNYWCTTDSNTVAANTYDGYDNASLGLITFMPIDTIGCYLTGCNLILTTQVTNATCDTCPDGSATVYVANGFAPYTYTWLTSPIQTTQTAVGLASGTYTVCVTDGNGCTACNSNVFVDSTNCTGFSVSAAATNATCATCTDGSATATITGGSPPYTYTWFTSPIQNTPLATGLAMGTYVVCAGDANGCIDCDTVIVGIGNCSAYFSLYPDTVPQQYFAVNMASGVPPLSFSWNWGDSSPNDTIPYPSHAYAVAGFYTICLAITDSVGCTDSLCVSYYLTRAASSMILVNVVASLPTGIYDTGIDNLFSVFPNPSYDFLNINFDETLTETVQIKIYDVFGKEVRSTATIEQHNRIDVSKLPKGSYFVEVIFSTQAGRQKFIKQ